MLPFTLAVALLAGGLVSADITSIKHPGTSYTSEQIEEYKANVESGKEPWASAYDSLLSLADPEYKMKGPGAKIGRKSGDGQIETWSTYWESDGEMLDALGMAYSINGEEAYAGKIVEIVNAWSETLEEVVNKDNIMVVWRGRQFANAAEMVYHLNGGSWPSGEDDYKRAQSMVSNILLPAAYGAGNLDLDQPAAGGGQAVMGHTAGLMFAVFTNNVTGFNQELEILSAPRVCEGFGGGGLQAMFLPSTGQNAESGRDQTHSGIEVGFSEQAAWVAANQGDTSLFDLEGDDGTPLLLLGLEYYFKYNLGNDDVPFDTKWAPCCCGNAPNGYDKISEIGRGSKLPFGEAGYRYYHGTKGYDMPYTAEWLAKHRPMDDDYIGFSTVALAEGTI